MAHWSKIVLVLNIVLGVVALYDTIVIGPAGGSADGFGSGGSDLICILSVIELLVLFLIKKATVLPGMILNALKLVVLLFHNWKQPAGFAFTQNGWIELVLIVVIFLLYLWLRLSVWRIIHSYKKKD